ncbi:MAG TPA: hypothetical protein VH062_07590 [Polyangiaceae bacterium]|nr:hypothetical protein [Polyangiaceae bacterium]
MIQLEIALERHSGERRATVEKRGQFMVGVGGLAPVLPPGGRPLAPCRPVARRSVDVSEALAKLVTWCAANPGVVKSVGWALTGFGVVVVIFGYSLPPSKAAPNAQDAPPMNSGAQINQTTSPTISPTFNNGPPITFAPTINNYVGGSPSSSPSLAETERVSDDVSTRMAKLLFRVAPPGDAPPGLGGPMKPSVAVAYFPLGNFDARMTARKLREVFLAGDWTVGEAAAEKYGPVEGIQVMIFTGGPAPGVTKEENERWQAAFHEALGLLNEPFQVFTNDGPGVGYIVVGPRPKAHLSRSVWKNCGTDDDRQSPTRTAPFDASNCPTWRP